MEEKGELNQGIEPTSSAYQHGVLHGRRHFYDCDVGLSVLGCRADIIGTMTITVQSCLIFTETVLTIRGGEPRTPPSTFTQLLSSEACSMLLYVHRDCRGGEPRTATSTFWLLSSDTDTRSLLLYVHRDRSDYYGREPRAATSTFTQLLSSARKCSAQCCCTSTKPIRAIRDGEPRTATSTFTQLGL